MTALASLSASTTDESEGWAEYISALKTYRADPTSANARLLMNAYEAWGAAFGLSSIELSTEMEKFRRALIAEQRKAR